MKKESESQKKANARNQLFRQIHGYNITHFAEIADNNNAITDKERAALSLIEGAIKALKDGQFEGSKKVGLKPKRRCQYCNGIARFEADTHTEDHVRLCNKHKVELEHLWSEYCQCYAIRNIKKINPYE